MLCFEKKYIVLSSSMIWPALVILFLYRFIVRDSFITHGHDAEERNKVDVVIETSRGISRFFKATVFVLRATMSREILNVHVFVRERVRPL